MMKLTFAIIFALATTVTLAQGPNNQRAYSSTTQSSSLSLEQRAEAITASMAKNLHLSAEQVKKVREINLTSMQQAEEARTKYKQAPQQFAQQMDIISQTRLSRIKDALTQQQFMQYQDRREEKMGVPKEAKSNPAARQQNGSNEYHY